MYCLFSECTLQVSVWHYNAIMSYVNSNKLLQLQRFFFLYVCLKTCKKKQSTNWKFKQFCFFFKTGNCMRNELGNTFINIEIE